VQIVPIPFREASAFILANHRHHRPPRGHKLSLAVAEEGRIVGVAVLGRPVARMLDDGFTAEVTRCCTNGTRNTCSFLYAAAWRAARALGYRRLVTYTLKEESGASLRGAGWKLLGERGGGSWNRKGRPRHDKHPLQLKLCWQRSV